MDKAYIQLEHTGELYPFFLLFGTRKAILMENTGEQKTAAVAGQRYFLRQWECAGGHLFYWDQDFSFSGWTWQKYAQICIWRFLPALLERLISLSFLVAFCWPGYNEKKKWWNFHQQNNYIANYGQSWNCHFLAVMSNELQYATSGGKYQKESAW